MGLYRDEGIVLRTHKLGESDRIVSIFTKGRGKVRAVAKGVRKTKSRFGARLEPPTHLQLLFYEGRELDIVTQAETVDHFRTIRDDLDRLTRAVSMLEAVDQLGLEGEPNEPLYQMLLGALRALVGPPAGRSWCPPSSSRSSPSRASGRWSTSASSAAPPRRSSLRPRLRRHALPGPPAWRVALTGGARAPQRHPRRSPGIGAQRRPLRRHARGRAPVDPRGRAPPRAPPPLDRGLRPRVATALPLRRVGAAVGVSGAAGGAGRVGRGRGSSCFAASSHCIHAIASGSHWM